MPYAPASGIWGFREKVAAAAARTRVSDLLSCYPLYPELDLTLTAPTS